MTNGVKIGLLGVIAALLGVIAYWLVTNSGESTKTKEIVQTEAASGNASPGIYPVKDGKIQTENGTMNVPSTSAINSTGAPQPINPGAQGGQTVGSASANRPKTSIRFDESVHDFGTMKQGDRLEYSFKFTNAGKEPLIIEDAKGSCGCTVPIWPKDPIPPGKSDEIKVSFNSAGKSGAQSKMVTLTANTEPIQTQLTIKANVLVPEGSEPAKH